MVLVQIIRFLAIVLVSLNVQFYFLVIYVVHAYYRNFGKYREVWKRKQNVGFVLPFIELISVSNSMFFQRHFYMCMYLCSSYKTDHALHIILYWDVFTHYFIMSIRSLSSLWKVLMVILYSIIWMYHNLFTHPFLFNI